MKIAAYQAKAVNGDRLEAIKTISKVLASTDADIVCFPECYLTGYFRKMPEAFNESIDLSSKDFGEVLATLAAFDQTVILGLIEREGNNLFNTAVVTKQGKLLGKYRKQHVNESAFLAWDQSPVFDQDGTTFGINICNDANYPECAKELSKLGAKIIFYPLNNTLPKEIADKWRSKHLENLIARARPPFCVPDDTFRITNI